jgi:hypothetical protein
MSTINRYRTLVRNISRVYAATNDSAAVLEKGLDEIVECAAPADADTWNKVGIDSERLLTVWTAREKDPAAQVLADQLINALYEFAEADTTAAPVAPPPTPALVITEPDKIAHVPSAVLTLADSDSDSEDETAVEAEAASETSEEAEDVEVEVEADESASEAEEEAEGEAADSDDEVGLEVEQVFYRGRPYWLESNTKQLFAVLGEEDVGDEIGTWPDYPAGKPKINV